MPSGGPGAPPSLPGVFAASTAVAPATASGAFLDWWVHLLGAPAKQMALAEAGRAQWQRTWASGSADPPVEPQPRDKRFADPLWQLPP